MPKAKSVIRSISNSKNPEIKENKIKLSRNYENSLEIEKLNSKSDNLRA